MTCHFGEGVILCDGQSGGWRVQYVLCPWCCLPGDEPVRVLAVWIYSGYGGEDFICGVCGQAWSNDGETYLRKLTCDERDENIARVAERPEPRCLDCQDTGDCSMPLAEEPERCKCQGPISA